MSNDPGARGGPLTEPLVAALTPPLNGNRIKWDTHVRGFGVRVTAADARSFILNYRTKSGRERRITLGSLPEWKVADARLRAKELRRQVDTGEDPLEERIAARTAKTLGELIDIFDRAHISAALRPDTQKQYLLKNHVSPQLRSRVAAEVTRDDIRALHAQVGKRYPYAANRLLGVLSKLFNLAVEQKLLVSNPANGIAHKPESRRQRILTEPELRRLMAALAKRTEPHADIIRLLLLTGARKGEALGAMWSHLDLESGVWTKPPTHTKQKSEHRTALSVEAVELLRKLRAATNSAMAFPALHQAERFSRSALDRYRKDVCRATGLGSVRLHDLRHNYATLLVNNGLSLPVIGSLLGHSKPETTVRYTRVGDASQRDATAIVGRLVRGAA